MQSSAKAVPSTLPIGHVSEASPQLQAVSASGTSRHLSKGDPVYLGETILNQSEGTTVLLQMNDGTKIQLHSATSLVLDESLLPQNETTQAQTDAQDPNQVSAIDPEQITQQEPTGAGPGTNAGGGNGASAGGENDGFGFIALSRLDGALTPTSGFETSTFSLGFPEATDALIQEAVLAEPTPVIPPPIVEPPVIEPEPFIARPDENQIADTDLDIMYSEGSYYYQFEDGMQILPAAIQGELLLNDDAGAQLTGVSFQGISGVLDNGIWSITDTNGIWSLQVEQTSGAYEFVLLHPFPHAEAGIDIASLVFDYQVQNDAGQTAATTLTIFITDDVPSAGTADTSTVQEHGLQSEGEGTYSYGNINFDYGNDGPGSLKLASSNQPALTSHGETILYSLSDDGQTLTGYVGEGEGQHDIFTLSLDDGNSSSYQFHLTGPLDHPDNSSLDTLSLHFGYEVTDGDGDKDPGSITINVVDDGPEINCLMAVDVLQSASVEEGLIPANHYNIAPYNGFVEVNYGADGPGQLGFTGAQVPEGLNYSISEDGHQIDGFAGETRLFNITMNDNGAYEFQQYGEIDTNGNGEGGVVLSTISFAVQAQDFDGDTDNCDITVPINNIYFVGSSDAVVSESLALYIPTDPIPEAPPVLQYA